MFQRLGKSKKLLERAKENGGLRESRVYSNVEDESEWKDTESCGSESLTLEWKGLDETIAMCN